MKILRQLFKQGTTIMFTLDNELIKGLHISTNRITLPSIEYEECDGYIKGYVDEIGSYKLRKTGNSWGYTLGKKYIEYLNLKEEDYIKITLNISDRSIIIEKLEM